MKIRNTILALAAMLTVGQAAFGVALTVSGYTQDFDSMGTAGTTPPTDWVVYTGNSGTANNTWTSTIPANGTNSVASMVLAGTPLTATSNPTATNNNGYNAARTTSATSDRVLATSPTTVSGAALQLTLTNATGGTLRGLTVSYDTVRYAGVSSANELPGHWLFYSTDGSTWANVAALNPTISTVPNTVGVTSVANQTFQFASPVSNGGTIRLRWVDDNAQQTSPDQIIGLNNVVVNPLPDLILQRVTTGTAAFTITGGTAGSYNPATYAIPSGSQTNGNVTFGFSPANPANGTVIVALDLSGSASDIAAAIAALGASTTVNPVFGSGYDAQVTLTDTTGSSLYNLAWNLTGTNVTLTGIAVIPEPTMLVGLLPALALVRRSRR